MSLCVEKVRKNIPETKYLQLLEYQPSSPSSTVDFLPFNKGLRLPKTTPPGIRTSPRMGLITTGPRRGSSMHFSIMEQERTYSSLLTCPREVPAQLDGAEGEVALPGAVGWWRQTVVKA